MPDRDTNSLVESLQITRELALDFFVTFARFEYALKAAGFVHQPHGVAEADWDCFFTFLEQLPTAEIAPVIAAGKRLLDEPPKRLVLDGKDPSWREVRRGHQADIRFIFEAVKRARNNLFHGGKWITSPQRVDRNRIVVSDALNVLRALLDVPGAHRLRHDYDDC